MKKKNTKLETSLLKMQSKLLKKKKIKYKNILTKLFLALKYQQGVELKLVRFYVVNSEKKQIISVNRIKWTSKFPYGYYSNMKFFFLYIFSSETSESSRSSA